MCGPAGTHTFLLGSWTSLRAYSLAKLMDCFNAVLGFTLLLSLVLENE
uniref:Uncharacterized protein n=1 Tax=Lepeophtheirus salmonis TaxID=72036 RepID=A0A0K2TUE4_LEPSM